MSYIALSSSPAKGNGLFASSAIPPGSLIFTVSSPLITVPDNTHLSETCHSCMTWKPASYSSTNTYYNSSTPLQKCTACRTAYYCNQACQREDWKLVHKKECKTFARLHPRVLPASVRALVRLLLLQPSLPPETWKAVITLETHATEFGAAEKWDEIRLMAKGAHVYSGTALPEPMVLRLYCTMLVNTLTLTTPSLDPIGLCFDPLPANANHSCVPNASIIFSGRSLHLRSIDDIPKDTEITVPYVDTTFPSPTRQMELSSRWFFTCSCELCSQAPLGKTDIFSCPHCSGTVPNTEPLTCNSCHKSLSLPHQSDDLGALYKTRLFPPHRQPLPSLHGNLIQAFLGERNYKEALKHQLLLHTVINPILYPQIYHPIRVCSGFVLAALLMEVSRNPGEELARLGVDWGKAVWAVLVEVESGMKGSHGENSGFAAVVRTKKAEVYEELGKAGVSWLGDGGKVEGLSEELAKVGVVVEGVLKNLKV